MREVLPVNPEVLKWARTSLGLSLEEAAPRLGRTFKAERLKEWEKGNGSPTYPQLERLAHEIYKRPVAVFFFPIVPEEENLKTEFRTLPDTMVDELPAEIVKVYRKAKLFQIYLEELQEGEKPVATSLLNMFEVKGRYLDASITKDVRKTLGISVEEQSEWRSPETAFGKWRDALEVNGIFVFKDAFRNDDYSGFCLYHRKYPIIFVNNSMPASRQVFTLFHELGHLLLHVGGIDFRSYGIVQLLRGYHLDVEVGCNRFANELLVPQEVFNSFKPVVSEASIEELAVYFSVSREVILRNYLDRGLVDNNYYEELASKWAAQVKKKGQSRGNYYYTQKAYLGDRYINLVYQNYYQNRITADSAADYLNIKPKNFPAFEHIVMEGGKL